MAQQKSTNQIIGVLKKIPMFEGLNIEQITKIFKICAMKHLEKDYKLCEAGDDSNQFYILINGHLMATLADGSKLSRISPLKTVGEMGVFSGEKRSATVIADTDCTLLFIGKESFFRVLNINPIIGMRVAMNINSYLSHKLRINQAIIEKLKTFCTREEYTKIVTDVMTEFGE